MIALAQTAGSLATHIDSQKPYVESKPRSVKIDIVPTSPEKDIMPQPSQSKPDERKETQFIGPDGQPMKERRMRKSTINPSSGSLNVSSGPNLVEIVMSPEERAEAIMLAFELQRMAMKREALSIKREEMAIRQSWATFTLTIAGALLLAFAGYQGAKNPPHSNP